MEPVLALLLGIINIVGQLQNYGIKRDNPHLKDIRVRRDINFQPYAFDNKHQVKNVEDYERPVEFELYYVKDKVVNPQDLIKKKHEPEKYLFNDLTISMKSVLKGEGVRKKRETDIPRRNVDFVDSQNYPGINSNHRAYGYPQGVNGYIQGENGYMQGVNGYMQGVNGYMQGVNSYSNPRHQTFDVKSKNEFSSPNNGVRNTTPRNVAESFSLFGNNGFENKNSNNGTYTGINNKHNRYNIHASPSTSYAYSTNIGTLNNGNAAKPQLAIDNQAQTRSPLAYHYRNKRSYFFDQLKSLMGVNKKQNNTANNTYSTNYTNVYNGYNGYTTQPNGYNANTETMAYNNAYSTNIYSGNNNGYNANNHNGYNGYYNANNDIYKTNYNNAYNPNNGYNNYNNNSYNGNNKNKGYNTNYYNPYNPNNGYNANNGNGYNQRYPSNTHNIILNSTALSHNNPNTYYNTRNSTNGFHISNANNGFNNYNFTANRYNPFNSGYNGTSNNVTTESTTIDPIFKVGAQAIRGISCPKFLRHITIGGTKICVSSDSTEYDDDDDDFM